MGVSVLLKIQGVFFVCALFLIFSGCAARVPDRVSHEDEALFSVGTIIDAGTGREVSFESMIKDLLTVRIVYIGETHSNPAHHDIQLDILKALNENHCCIAVGMEMFAQPYQDVLCQWVNEELSENEFLENTHWYATWRFDFSLYRDLLEYVKDNDIALYGLNIEFHIPSKIAAGGIDSLLPYQKKQLPDKMDLSDTAHREFVKKVYEKHNAHVGERYGFENFYTAQVVWDEVMAEAVIRHINDRLMVVFAGSGHIVKGFGIPPRAYARSGFAYRTVNPHSAGEPVDFTAADYIWITPPVQNTD